MGGLCVAGELPSCMAFCQVYSLPRGQGWCLGGVGVGLLPSPSIYPSTIAWPAGRPAIETAGGGGGGGGAFVGQGWGGAWAGVIRPGRKAEVAGDVSHALLLAPEEIPSQGASCFAWCGAGGSAGATVGGEVAAEVVAGTINLLSSPGGFKAGLGLQLQVCDVGSERRDCSFCLKSLVGGGLEGTSDCAEALLLDLL